MAGKLVRLIEADKKISNLYTITRELGKGCFGQICECVEKKTGRQSVLKIQAAVAQEKHLTLEREYRLLRLMQHIDGIPKVYYFGKTPQFNVFEMERLEFDLEAYCCNHKDLTPEEVCEFGYKIIQILRQIHKVHVVHRDLKPQNIMFDCNGKIYLIDFGISTMLRNKTLKTKKIHRRLGYFIGTPRYASITAHIGEQILPKDDIQSLMYVLIYATTRTLPWVSVKSKQNKVQQIGNMKKRYPKSQLCKHLPKCYLLTFNYLETLQKDSQIDYDKVLQFFKSQNATSSFHTSKTLPELQSFKGRQNKQQQQPIVRSQTKKLSLNVPTEFLFCDEGIRSDRVIVEWMTKYVFDEDDESLNMSVCEEVLAGEVSLANKLGDLVIMHPKLKVSIEVKASKKIKERKPVKHVTWSLS